MTKGYVLFEGANENSIRVLHGCGAFACFHVVIERYPSLKCCFADSNLFEYP
jgi:hypothetical protein